MLLWSSRGVIASLSQNQPSFLLLPARKNEDNDGGGWWETYLSAFIVPLHHMHHIMIPHLALDRGDSVFQLSFLDC